MDTFTVADILTAGKCGEGFARGYKSTWPVSDLGTGHDVLAQWPSSTGPLKRFCRDYKEANRWLQSTSLVLEGFAEKPPPPTENEEDYFYNPDGSVLTGRTVVEPYLGEPAIIETKFPFLHRVRGLCEVVWVDTELEPMGIDRLSEFRMMAALTEALFHKMTGENLLTRLIAPQYGTEKLIDPPRLDARQKITDLRLAGIRGKTYGEHCNAIIEGRGRKSEWRCPIRDQCAPFK